MASRGYIWTESELRDNAILCLQLKKIKTQYKACFAAIHNGRFAWPSVSIITEDQPSLYFLPMFEIAFNRHDY